MPTKWETNREKASAEILSAAAAEFAEKGYIGAKIRNIAERAGVSNGLVGKYFGSKEDLVCAILEEYSLRKLYEGVTDTDPYGIFCLYIDHIRNLRKSDSIQFRLRLNMINGTDFPESIFLKVREGFEGSPLENAIRQVQQEGDLPAEDPFTVFRILSGTVYVLLNQYAVIGTKAPDNNAILHVFGYDRREREYRRQSERVNSLEADLKLLLAAVRENYPLSIFIDLSRNSYHMIDYARYTTRKAKPEGVYDDLIACGASTIPNEADRRKFLDLFERESLLSAFRNGERERSLIHLQTGDDGVDRWMSTRCMMSETQSGGIIAVCIGGAVDDHIRREFANIDHYRDQSLLSEILKNLRTDP